MKPVTLVLALVLPALLVDGARAQCQRGGGGGSSMATTSIGTSLTTAIPLNYSLGGQSMEQAYRQQMQMAYQQAAYLEQMRQAYQQQQAGAAQHQQKRQQKLDAVRERREAELARRAAAKERNLALRDSKHSLVARD